MPRNKRIKLACNAKSGLYVRDVGIRSESRKNSCFNL